MKCSTRSYKMLLVLQIAQYEAVAPEGQKLLLVLFWNVFRIMRPGGHHCISYRITSQATHSGSCPRLRSLLALYTQPIPLSFLWFLVYNFPSLRPRPKPLFWLLTHKNPPNIAKVITCRVENNPARQFCMFFFHEAGIVLTLFDIGGGAERAPLLKVFKMLNFDVAMTPTMSGNFFEIWKGTALFSSQSSIGSLQRSQ